VNVSEAEVTEPRAVAPERLARHREWERLMQVEVARALDDHRRNGRSIAVIRDENIVWLSPSQY
jgi:hypothetical protein